MIRESTFYIQNVLRPQFAASQSCVSEICRHQCAVSQLLGRTNILGGSIHPFYKCNTSGSTLLLDGPTSLGHIAGIFAEETIHLMKLGSHRNIYVFA